MNRLWMYRWFQQIQYTAETRFQFYLVLALTETLLLFPFPRKKGPLVENLCYPLSKGRTTTNNNFKKNDWGKKIKLKMCSFDKNLVYVSIASLTTIIIQVTSSR